MLSKIILRIYKRKGRHMCLPTLKRARPYATSIFLSFLFIPNFCYALPDDNQKQLNIVANSSQLNYKTGANVYEGNVKVDQGTTHITADRLTTQNNKRHKIEKAVAYGIQKRAEYSTIAKIGDPVFHAQAEKITFDSLKSIIILEGNATVTQGENSFQGTIIIYNMKDQTIVVPPSKMGQARILIGNT